MARPIRWLEPPPLGAPSLSLSGDRIVDMLLAARGVTDPSEAREWLDPSVRPSPHPGRFPNMERAIARTIAALDGGARIAVFGDYDADGITSAAILTLALRTAAGDPNRVLVRLPERADGYGLTPDVIEAFHAQGVSLVIAVDCGTNDVPALDRARSLGLDTIVVDHHHVTRDVADGELIINPHLRHGGDGAELTAAGLAFCFVAGLAAAGTTVVDEGCERDFLDLAAIGTIVDVGSLTGMNRAIVRDGLATLRKTRRPGLRELAQVAGCSLPTIDAEGVAFKLGPRLNAPGRLKSAEIALRLLMTTDALAARSVALSVDRINRDRKDLAAAVEAEARAQIAAGPGGGAPIAVAHAQGWRAGLLGAVAGRLADDLGVPTLLLADGADGVSVGSGRSVDGFDLVSSLESCRDLLVRFGGHRGAAGLSVETSNIPKLTEALGEAVSQSGIQTPLPVQLRIDADLDAADLTLETVRSIQRLAPFGTGNPEPLFRLRRARVLQASSMGADKSHLRLVIDGPAGGRGVKAVMFRAGQRASELPARAEIDLLAHLSIDTWGGEEKLDLRVQDFRRVG